MFVNLTTIRCPRWPAKALCRRGTAAYKLKTRVASALLTKRLGNIKYSKMLSGLSWGTNGFILRRMHMSAWSSAKFSWNGYSWPYLSRVWGWSKRSFKDGWLSTLNRSWNMTLKSKSGICSRSISWGLRVRHSSTDKYKRSKWQWTSGTAWCLLKHTKQERRWSSLSSWVTHLRFTICKRRHRRSLAWLVNASRRLKHSFKICERA